MKTLFTTLTLLVTSFLFSQVEYDPGYYIDANGEKFEVLILNEGWLNNPVSFTYKTNESSEPVIVKNNVKEFGVNNGRIFRLFNVLVDFSSTQISKLDNSPQPSFSDESLFLELIVSGVVDFYVYRNGNMYKYFYQKDGNVNQLIYKKYLSENKVLENNEYQTQLKTEIHCPSAKINYNNIDYTKSDLTRFFISYNECMNHDYAVIEKATKNRFSFGAKLGARFMNLKVTTAGNTVTKMGSETSLLIGAELEFYINNFNRKLSVFTDPSYQSYKTESEIARYSTTLQEYYTVPVNVSYSNIDLPFGLRYYLFLNNKSKLYFDGGYTIVLTLDDEMTLPAGDESPILDSNNSFFLGVGYQWNKFGISGRVHSNRDLLSNYLMWDSKSSIFDLTLSYNFF